VDAVSERQRQRTLSRIQQREVHVVRRSGTHVQCILISGEPLCAIQSTDSDNQQRRRTTAFDPTGAFAPAQAIPSAVILAQKLL
jgi:hypothetical protein